MVEKNVMKEQARAGRSQRKRRLQWRSRERSLRRYDDLKEVHRMVEMLKIDSETTIYCVRLMEKLERSKKEGEAIGEARGKAEGEARQRSMGTGF